MKQPQWSSSRTSNLTTLPWRFQGRSRGHLVVQLGYAGPSYCFQQPNHPAIWTCGMVNADWLVDYRVLLLPRWQRMTFPWAESLWAPYAFGNYFVDHHLLLPIAKPQVASITFLLLFWCAIFFLPRCWRKLGILQQRNTGSDPRTVRLWWNGEHIHPPSHKRSMDSPSDQAKPHWRSHFWADSSHHVV